MSPKTRKAFGLGRLLPAAANSMRGLMYCLRHEPGVRQASWLCVLGVLVVPWVAQSRLEGLILIGSLFLILLAELFNSAIETVVDRIGLEIHPLSGRAKDIASAPSFLAVVAAVITWLLVLSG